MIFFEKIFHNYGRLHLLRGGKMGNEWDELFTKAQEVNLIAKNVDALRQLVQMTEIRDLLRKILIATIRGGESHHSELMLTPEGLIEEFYCQGHCYPTMSDDYETDYCPKIAHKKVEEKDFSRVVKDYRLTAAQIVEVIVKLKA